MESKFEVPAESVQKEAEFYDNADQVQHDIDNFRGKLQAQSEEFNLLLEYYIRHQGRLDVKPASRPSSSGAARMPRPNLGTEDETWYYLDAKGNKIWVRNLKLDTRDPRSGAVAANEHADGRIVVVKVPSYKKNYAFPADYEHRCRDYDFYAATMGRPPSSSFRGHHAGRPPLLHEQQQEQQQKAPVSDTERYIASQRALGKSIGKNPVLQSTYVYRPPATLEEAQARLAELKEEEQRLRDAFMVRP